MRALRTMSSKEDLEDRICQLERELSECRARVQNPSTAAVAAAMVQNPNTAAVAAVGDGVQSSVSSQIGRPHGGRVKIAQLSAEVVDTNPYRYIFAGQSY